MDEMTNTHWSIRAIHRCGNIYTWHNTSRFYFFITYEQKNTTIIHPIQVQSRIWDRYIKTRMNKESLWQLPSLAIRRCKRCHGSPGRSGLTNEPTKRIQRSKWEDILLNRYTLKWCMIRRSMGTETRCRRENSYIRRQMRSKRLIQKSISMPRDRKVLILHATSKTYSTGDRTK